MKVPASSCYNRTMATQLTVEQAAESIINWAYSDSHVEIDRDALVYRLTQDYAATGRYPTEEECEVLVTGGDDGEIPEELIELFPETHTFIGTYWE